MGMHCKRSNCSSLMFPTLTLLIIGMGAALGAVCTSGLAGVLCERLLKGGSGEVTMSIRNVQLGVPSSLFGLVALYLQDSEKVATGGFFQGFTYWTWMVVVLHSIGVYA